MQKWHLSAVGSIGRKRFAEKLSDRRADAGKSCSRVRRAASDVVDPRREGSVQAANAVRKKKPLSSAAGDPERRSDALVTLAASIA